MKKMLAGLGIFVLAGAAGAAPMPATTARAQREMSAHKMDLLALQGSGPFGWNSLPGHDKGSIARSDTLPNSWLRENFNACDTDRNGKVSRSEYQTCRMLRGS